MLLQRGVLQCPGVASPMSGACSIQSANALRTFQAFKRRRTFLDSLRECRHTLFQLPFTSSKRLAYGHSVISSKYLARGRSICFVSPVAVKIRSVWPDTQVSSLRRGEERAVPILVPAAGVGVLSGKSKAVPEFKWKTRNLSGLVFSCIEADSWKFPTLNG